MVSTANYTKLKTNLSLCIQRLKLLEKKKTELAQKSRKEIAEYISQGKAERAKIRVEHIIREDYMVEAMEIVEMYCDTLLARFGMIEQLKTLDEGLEEAVSSLIWVAPRMQSDVKELKVVHDVLMMKYGKPYAQAARENQLKTVNERLMIKMGVQAPPKILVERYLIEIAKTLNVEYEPDQDILREDELYRKGGSGGGGGGNGNIAQSVPPPPGPLGQLIDLGAEQPSGLVLPPPLPAVPPASSSSASASASTSASSFSNSSSSNAPSLPNPAGFNDPTLNGDSGKGGKASEANSNFHLPPALPPNIAAPGAQSVPPSYESVVGGGGGQPGGTSGPDFDETHLPSVPNLPDIPSDDDDEPPVNKGKGGGGGGAGGPGGASGSGGGGGDDFDFDDLQRRFAELKKKKY